jgi:hypothetical protein
MGRIWIRGTARGTSRARAEASISTPLWVHWATIAVEHLPEAREARADESRAFPGEPKGWGLAWDREFHAALIGTMAAAFALDAFCGTVKPYVPVPQDVAEAWQKARTKRETRILETIKMGFAVGPHARRWGTEFRWLLDLRDPAVHAEERFDKNAQLLDGKLVERDVGNGIEVTRSKYEFDSPTYP